MNNDSNRQFILDNFIIPWIIHQPRLEIAELCKEQNFEEFYKLLIFPPLDASQLLLRGLIDRLFLNVPSKLRLQVTGIIKQLRNPHRSLRLRFPLDEKFNQNVFTLKDKLGSETNFWKGKRAAVCLSHDVDTRECYRFLPTVMKIDRDYGVPSVFNVLTHGDYNLDKNLLSELMHEGFEIGLHGYRHELGMARKPFRKIKTDLECSLDLLLSLGVEVKGFRAPGFSMSTNILSVLDDLGFTYDSSMQLCNGLYPSCGISFPYKYPGKTFWEIPLTVQDDLFFRDARVDESDALNILEKIVLQTIQLGGVAFFNFHPCLIQGRISFYKMFLEILCNCMDDLWIVLPRDICYFLDIKMECKAQ